MQSELFQSYEENSKIWKISEINSAIRKVLEQNFSQVWVRGEISNLKAHSSGHYYFQLKDSNAQIKAVLFRGDSRNLASPPKEGSEYLAFGDITSYEARGDCQIRVRHLMQEGMGNLQLEFERLKKKLSNEGLFNPEKKKTLPRLPQKIALVTSPEGAAKEDFIGILKRRNWKGLVTLFPSLVQGTKASSELIKALHSIDKSKESFDLVVLTRGGGSIEDLWSFNEEELVRLISDFEIPTISAIGHQTDFVLTDFAADIRAETPSGAAELISSLYIKELENFENLLLSLKQSTQSSLSKFRESLNMIELQLKLLSPRSKLEQAQQTIDDLGDRLKILTYNSLKLKRGEIDFFSKVIEGLNVQKIINKGFCYAEDQDGKIISDAVKISNQQSLVLNFRDGTKRVTAS
jgi:exodeoxyribonuclease VII large subunit